MTAQIPAACGSRDAGIRRGCRLRFSDSLLHDGMVSWLLRNASGFAPLYGDPQGRGAEPFPPHRKRFRSLFFITTNAPPLANNHERIPRRSSALFLLTYIRPMI